MAGPEGSNTEESSPFINIHSRGTSSHPPLHAPPVHRPSSPNSRDSFFSLPFSSLSTTFSISPIRRREWAVFFRQLLDRRWWESVSRHLRNNPREFIASAFATSDGWFPGAKPYLAALLIILVIITPLWLVSSISGASVYLSEENAGSDGNLRGEWNTKGGRDGLDAVLCHAEAVYRANMANRKASLGGHLQPMLKDFHHMRMRVLIPTYPCPYEERVGAWGVGGKWVCLIPTAVQAKPVVYSVGSDEEYSFEESMFRHYRSQPYTLDPFLSPQAQARMQLLRFLHFHSLGLAGKASLGDYQKWNPNVTFRTLPELMQDLNHTYVDILKLSCGGCEEEVIFDVYEGSVNGTAGGAGRGMREKVDQFRSLEEAAVPAAPAAPAELAAPADAAAAGETAAGTGAAEPAGAIAEPTGAVAEPGGAGAEPEGASGSGSGGVRNYEEGREDAVDPSVGARLAINGGKLPFGQLVVDFHEADEPQELLSLVYSLETVGYRMFHIEDNPLCDLCITGSFIHESLVQPHEWAKCNSG